MKEPCLAVGALFLMLVGLGCGGDVNVAGFAGNPCDDVLGKTDQKEQEIVFEVVLAEGVGASVLRRSFEDLPTSRRICFNFILDRALLPCTGSCGPCDEFMTESDHELWTSVLEGNRNAGGSKENALAQWGTPNSVCATLCSRCFRDIIEEVWSDQ